MWCSQWNALAAGSLTGLITASPSKNPKTMFVSAVVCGAIGLSVNSFADYGPPKGLSEPRVLHSLNAP